MRLVLCNKSVSSCVYKVTTSIASVARFWLLPPFWGILLDKRLVGKFLRTINILGEKLGENFSPVVI